MGTGSNTDVVGVGGPDKSSAGALMESDTATELGGRTCGGSSPDDLQVEAARRQIEEQTAEALRIDPGYAKRSLADLSREAAALQKQAMYTNSIAAYNKLFLKAKVQRTTHKELFVCYGNRASAYLKLGLFQEALQDAEKSRAMAEEALRKAASASHAYVRCFALKLLGDPNVSETDRDQVLWHLGRALVGLRRYREAMQVFEEGLKYDPFHPEMKEGQEDAIQQHVQDLLEGRGKETLALPQTEIIKHRITYHAHSAPLHKVRNDNMMPKQLLSTFHADSDYHIKDTYNYVTVRTDVAKPMEHVRYLEDEYRQSRMAAAVTAAVKAITARELDCRVLHIGAGVGMHTLTALKAGAYHVTAAERWLYLASCCKEVLVANGCNDDQVKVVYKRPSDLALLEDVPIVCNLVIAEMLDDGLLSSGIIPAVRHALGSSLLTHDAAIIPASATVYMQAVQLLTPDSCGLDMGATNSARWHPSHTSGIPYPSSIYTPLSDPVEVWHFDMLNPPPTSDFKHVDIRFNRKGSFNAVMFWYDLHLAHGIHLCTGPDAVADSLTSLRPAFQYLPGEISVDADFVLPVVASHNTIRLSFDVEEAEYTRLQRPSPAFPALHYSMLADIARNEAYDRAITRAVQRVREAQGEVHVLDMGAGAGLLSLMAARAGADSVVAAELLPDLCEMARRVAASNGLSNRISVVTRDVAKLQRGKDVRRRGVNLVVADMFDAGLTGHCFEWLLEMAKKNVIRPGAEVVPAAATVYCIGVEVLTASAGGHNMHPINRYRWDKSYSSVSMRRIPHKVLTKPRKVVELHFNGQKGGQVRDSLLKLEVIAEGRLNAVVFWFDLHMDELETITNAPPGFSMGGLEDKDFLVPCNDDLLAAEIDDGDQRLHKPQVPAESVEEETNRPGVQSSGDADHYWGQALQYFDRSLQVQPGGKRVPVLLRKEGSKMSFSLRDGVGEMVEKAPWKVEWGGGSSIENPHVQRVQYCDLLVKDFLQRVKGKRFPSIEKDMKMVLAQCGSLYLDPGHTSEVYHNMVLLEKIHQDVAEFSPGVIVEALTQSPITMH